MLQRKETWCCHFVCVCWEMYALIVSSCVSSCDTQGHDRFQSFGLPCQMIQPSLFLKRKKKKNLFFFFFFLSPPALLSGSSQPAIWMSRAYGWLQKLSSFPPCIYPSATLQHFTAAAGEQLISPSLVESCNGNGEERAGLLEQESSLKLRQSQAYYMRSLPQANMHIKTLGGFHNETKYTLLLFGGSYVF